MQILLKKLHLVLFGGGLRPPPQRPQQLHQVARLRRRRAARPRGAQAGVHAGPAVGFASILCIYSYKRVILELK